MFLVILFAYYVSINDANDGKMTNFDESPFPPRMRKKTHPEWERVFRPASSIDLSLLFGGFQLRQQLSVQLSHLCRWPDAQLFLKRVRKLRVQPGQRFSIVLQGQRPHI